MQIISQAQTRGVLTIHQAAQIVDATYRGIGEGEVEASVPSVMRIGSTDHRLGTKGAVLAAEGIAGVRLTSRAAPRLMLWSLATGEPIAFLDESFLYRFRTGISAAVVAQYLLQGRRPRRAAIVGAGPIAMEIVRAIHEILKPGEIAVAARRAASARKFSRKAQEAGINVLPAPDVESSVDGADLLVTITSAATELIGPSHVNEDAVLLSMGGVFEVSHDVWVKSVARFVDDLDYALKQGDAAAWIASGTTTEDKFKSSLTGTVGELAAGRWGGTASQGIRMAIVQGVTALDVALAHAVVQAIQNDGANY